ncbi:MAG TPA: H(2)-dependent methylenetetrahydromethanopterin dehydrogenase-related protein, partial [Methanothermococcus okinawensis]|nr:H(2)-dependent methylenetetrahydromethanopterin dehydrogenase-related protein [Methanothermococcus okinawensis]
GSRMAMEFAEAGHDVILSEPNRDMLTEEMWEKVEESGVKVTNNDIEAAKHGELHILYTPTQSTLEIAKKIIDHLPKDAVLLTTCTICPVVVYSHVLSKLRDRKDIGFSSMHPTIVPGTPQHDHYIIGGRALDGKMYLTEEQLNKCIQLAESVNKKPYIVPMGMICPLGNMGSAAVMAMTLAAILEYHHVGTKVIGYPEETVEREIIMALQVMAAIIRTSGIYGLLKAINMELLIKNASIVHLTEDQEILETTLKKLKNIDPEIWEKVKKAKVYPTKLVDSQAIVEELKTLIGGRAAEGAIERSRKKLFMKW